MNKNAWNRFVLEHGPRSGRFLQSWEWGEFQRAMGERVRREEMVEDGALVGVAQWIDRRLPLLGEYAYCPKGPVVNSKTRELAACGRPATPLSAEGGSACGGNVRFSTFRGARLPAHRNFIEFWNSQVAGKGVGGAIGVGGSKGTVFLRVEPEEGTFLGRAVKSIDVSPSHTRITDVSATDEELLAAMHSKTRYNIRLAQKRGVNVKLTGGNFASTWKLLEQTASRGQFRLHSREYYEKMLESLTGDCRAFLATASHDGKLLAANIMIDFGDTRTYLHGASSNEQRNFMAPYLLHWELLRDARERGLRYYDWWGVAPLADPPPARGGARGGGSHPWAGISRFKRGFPGVECASPGTFDFVLKPRRYHLYQFARRLRRSL